MIIYVVVCDGKYTEEINGESVTADRVELLGAYRNHADAIAKVQSNPDVADPKGWGIRAIFAAPCELQD